jgi:hypothetical protein
MLRRLTSITILAAAVAAGSATTAAANRSCGTAREGGGNGQTVRVTIVRGRLSCSRARRAITSIKPGRGVVQRGGGSVVGTSCTYPDGWTCQFGESGSFPCYRGGSGPLRISHARDQVEGIYLPLP